MSTVNAGGSRAIPNQTNAPTGGSQKSSSHSQQEFLQYQTEALTCTRKLRSDIGLLFQHIAAGIQQVLFHWASRNLSAFFSFGISSRVMYIEMQLPFNLITRRPAGKHRLIFRPPTVLKMLFFEKMLSAAIKIIFPNLKFFSFLKKTPQFWWKRTFATFYRF